MGVTGAHLAALSFISPQQLSSFTPTVCRDSGHERRSVVPSVGRLLVGFDVGIAKLFFVDFDYHVVFLSEDLGELGTVNALVENELKLVLRAQLVHDVLALGEVLRRREHGVDGQADGVLEHRGNQAGKERRRQLQAWVRVHLDQVNFELLVDHKVKAIALQSKLGSYKQLRILVNRNLGHKITLNWMGFATYFEGVETLVRVHLAPGGTEAIGR